jgi:predicted nuclease with TOPRIM domain
MVRIQTESINEKCYKTQSYIRSLMREETNLNENLSKIEDENNKLDSSISELDTIVSINQN